MVAAKAKLSMHQSRQAEDQNSSKSVGTKNFKIYTENENVEVQGRASVAVDRVVTGKGAIMPARKKLAPVNKGTSQINVKDVEKSKNKRDSSVKINVGRKVLADVSNFRGYISRKEVQHGSKSTKGKSEKCTSSQRVSVGPGIQTLVTSSRKSYKGQVTENLGQGSKDIKLISSDDKRVRLQGQQFVNIGRRTTKNPPIPARRSLPVAQRANKEDENNENSEKAKGKLRTKIGQKVTQISYSRSRLWRNRASDGFLVTAPRGQTKVDSHALSRKIVRPITNTRFVASNAPRIFKSNCTSSSNKLLPVDATSSKEEVATSLPENINAVVPHEPSNGEFPSDSNNNLSTKASDVIASRGSNRRRSYTSLLMTRSKLLEERGEVVKQEELPNIDDNNNCLEVSEYVDDIYQFYWVAESLVQNPSLADYMKNQTDITPQMRGILINWLIEVHFKFDLMQETLYLMVTLLDRYLSLVAIKKNEMQLAGLTALLLASKYEDFWHPRVIDLISISAESYTRDQLLGMEKLFLKELKFRLNSPTSYVFMLRFLKAAQSDTKLEHLAFYLIELCLTEYEALKFKPSMLCASAIYVARQTLQIKPAWTPLLAKHARYDKSQIRECAEMILRFHKAARTGMLNVTYEKYLSPELSKVAVIKPMDKISP